MKKATLLAAIICAITAFIHIFMGGKEIVKPLLEANLAAEPKLTLYAVWHMVSAVLVWTSILLFYIFFKGNQQPVLSNSMGILYLTFGIIFLVIAMVYPEEKLFLKLPQWSLLIPIGVFSLLGAKQSPVEQ